MTAACLAAGVSNCGPDAAEPQRAPLDAGKDGASVHCRATAPYGLALGETIEDLVFRDCFGMPSSIHGSCGSKATVIVNFYGWCTSYYDYLALADELQSTYGDRGLASMIVITESTLETPPTLAYCAWISERYDIRAATVIDEQAKLEQLGAADLVVVLDRDGKIVMQRIGPTKSAVVDAIEQELARPDLP